MRDVNLSIKKYCHHNYSMIGVVAIKNQKKKHFPGVSWQSFDYTIMTINRHGSRINTDRFPKRAPKAQASCRFRGRVPSGCFSGFDFLKFPFQGFRVIQTGFQLGKCFLLLKIYLPVV